MKSKKKHENSTKKFISWLLIFSIVIFVVSSISLKFLIPADDTKIGFQVTIKGTVTTEVDEDSLPQYVWAYKDYTYFDRLYKEGKVIKLTNIQWDLKKGTYSITFWLPIEQRVIITTYPQGCNHQFIDVSPNSNVHTIDLTHDQNRCSSVPVNIPNSITELEKRVKDGLKGDFSKSTDSSFTSNQTKKIQDDIDLAEEELEEYDYLDQSNSSLIHLYRAFWLDWRASYRLAIYETESCMENLLSIFDGNETCEVYPFETIEGIGSINKSLEIYGESGWIFGDNAYRNDNIEQIKFGIYSISQNRNTMREALRDCEEYTGIILKSQKNQEPICNMRKNSLIVINWAQALAFICLGFLIYSSIRRWIEK